MVITSVVGNGVKFTDDGGPPMKSCLAGKSTTAAPYLWTLQLQHCGSASVFQPGDIFLDHSIDLLKIHTQVVVDQDIPKSGQPFPVHLWIAFLDAVAGPQAGHRPSRDV
jgi:hypothetical protein